MLIKKIDIPSWERKDAYKHYIGFQNPYFNLTAHLEIGPLYNYCKQRSQSIYFTYQHLTTKVANEIDEFHYRIEDEGVKWFERIDCAPTLLDEKKKLLFSHLDYHENQELFIKNSQEITQQVIENNILDPGNKLHVIYTTAIPWVAFTSVRHPFHEYGGHGIPIIAFGKIYDLNGKKLMPVSLDVHHALMDGYHAGLFFEKLQEYFLVKD